MRNLSFLCFCIGLLTIGLSSCEKDNMLSPNTNSKPNVSGDWVDLVVDKGGQKSDRIQCYVNRYPFSVGRVPGGIEMSLSEDGNLVSSRMSRRIYEDLKNKYGSKEVVSIPQKLLNYSKLMSKSGYSFYANNNFIPPMSKTEFNRRWQKCTGKPTTAGVLLCSINLLVEAITDCLNASPDAKKIHCW